jgi:hypothetical protein
MVQLSVRVHPAQAPLSRGLRENLLGEATKASKMSILSAPLGMTQGLIYG